MKKRVKIPANKPAQLLDLAKRVQQKHIADGDGSVLKILNWQEVNQAIEQASRAHENAERLKREMLEAYQQRTLKVDSVIGFLRNSRDILTGAYSREMKSLGQWGYDVFEQSTTKPDDPQLRKKAEPQTAS
jgi:hypothetical protein